MESSTKLPRIKPKMLVQPHYRDIRIEYLRRLLVYLDPKEKEFPFLAGLLIVSVLSPSGVIPKEQKRLAVKVLRSVKRKYLRDFMRRERKRREAVRWEKPRYRITFKPAKEPAFIPPPPPKRQPTKHDQWIDELNLNEVERKVMLALADLVGMDGCVRISMLRLKNIADVFYNQAEQAIRRLEERGYLIVEPSESIKPRVYRFLKKEASDEH